MSAMQEAMGSQEDVSTPFPSAASYAHFLRARLAHHEGDHRVALDELRLALASDDQNPYLMTELAEQYARAAELEQAERQLQRVIEKTPNYAPAQLLMGRVLYEGGKFARAKTALNKAIKLKPADPEAYLVLTQLWLDTGRPDEATKVIDELATAVPGEPIGFHRLGLALAEKGDAIRAENLLVRAIERDPGDIEAWATLARIAESQGQLQKAAQNWQRAAEFAPENREILLNAGRIALRLKKVQEAQAYFGEILAQGSDAETSVKIAFAYLASRQLQLAAKVLDQARAPNTEPRLHFYAGLVYERAREFEKAAAAFDAVPDSLGEVALDARVHRASCLSLIGRNQEALAALTTIQKEKPALPGLDAALSRVQERAGLVRDAEVTLVKSLGRQASIDVLDALGSFYTRQNRLDDAVTLLTGALTRVPDDEQLTFALATTLERQGDWKQAITRVRKLVEADPSNATALNFIGYTLAAHGGELDEAEKFVRRALELRPDSSAFLDSLGVVLFKKGQLDAARATLERAIDGGPDDATLFEHIGDVASKAGDKARAQQSYNRALKALSQNPDDAERLGQREDLERKLKLLTPGGKGR